MTQQDQQLFAAFQAALPGLREELDDFIGALGIDAPRDLICRKLEAQGWDEDDAFDAATETIKNLAFELRNDLTLALTRFAERHQPAAPIADQPAP